MIPWRDMLDGILFILMLSACCIPPMAFGEWLHRQEMKRRRADRVFRREG